MAEISARKEYQSDEERKLSERLEKEVVKNRISATERLIKIATEPPVYLSTSLISESSVLTSMVHSTSHNSETNGFGDKCLVCLPHDGIPRDTWKIFSLLINNSETKSIEINDTTLDDLFYICFKYNISFTLISETTETNTKDWTKIQAVIINIYDKSRNQRFPRTRDIPEVNSYYEILGKVFAKIILGHKRRKERISSLQYYKMIPSIYHAITSEIAVLMISMHIREN